MYGVKRIWPWLLLWGIVDLLCALFCEIHADEAYYRLYGQFLAWGYFDHPPMVGLMTAASAALVPATSLILKNLSVRLVTVLLHVGTVWVLWKAVQSTELWKFLLVAASIPMFCAYGFLTTPDAPLLFFAALFFYAYRRYLTDRSWSATVLLGLSMAGLMYSKYIAALVIAFAVLGNWRIVKEGRFWAAVGIALALLTPHIAWQFQHGWPSLVHQWSDRALGYQPLYTLEFIPNQLAVFNPFVWALMLWLGAKAILSKDAFQRSLGCVIWGLQVFFFIMTFRGHVEPHWTVAATVPAIILLTESELMDRKWLRASLAVFVGLILIARVILMLNILPASTGLAHKQEQCEQLHEQAQGLPIVFDGSFQRTSLYRFFYNDEAVRVRQPNERMNHYDLLHLEDALMGQPVCIMRSDTVRFVDALTKEDLDD